MSELKCQKGVCKGGDCQRCANKLLHDAGFRLDGTPINGGSKKKKLRTVSLTDEKVGKGRVLYV